MNATPSEPEPAGRPLDRDEERSLAALEQGLRRTDPGLESEMAALAKQPERPASRPAGPSLDQVLRWLAIGVIALLIVPDTWLAGILSFGLLLGVPLAMVLVAARARRAETERDDDSREDGDERRR